MLTIFQTLAFVILISLSAVQSVDRDTKRPRLSSSEFPQDQPVQKPPAKKTIWQMLLHPDLPKDSHDLVKYHFLMRRPNTEEFYLLMRDNAQMRDHILSSPDVRFIEHIPSIFKKSFLNQDDHMIEAFLKSPRLVNSNFVRLTSTDPHP